MPKGALRTIQYARLHTLRSPRKLYHEEVTHLGEGEEARKESFESTANVYSS